jgi:Flp pilus assembly protein TadG
MLDRQIQERKRQMNWASRILKHPAGDGERGSALVEFSVCTVVFITLIFGIVEFSYAIYSYNFVSNAAREGTRYAMVRGTNCTGSCTQISGCVHNQTCSALQTYINGMAAGINTNNLTVQAACVPSAGVYTALPCNPGIPIQVQVQYTFYLFAPLSSRSLTMSSTSQRVGWQ